MVCRVKGLRFRVQNVSGSILGSPCLGNLPSVA